jgi:hypothetical protein
MLGDATQQNIRKAGATGSPNRYQIGAQTFSGLRDDMGSPSMLEDSFDRPVETIDVTQKGLQFLSRSLRPLPAVAQNL